MPAGVPTYLRYKSMNDVPMQDNEEWVIECSEDKGTMVHMHGVDYYDVDLECRAHNEASVPY